MVKPGQIVGILIGAALILFPVVGFVTHEASLSDTKGQMIGIGFIVFGAFMIILNLIGIITGTDNLLAAASSASAPVAQAPQKAKSENAGNKIICRFCGKKYSSDYNGCPYCKKK